MAVRPPQKRRAMPPEIKARVRGEKQILLLQSVDAVTVVVKTGRLVKVSTFVSVTSVSVSVAVSEMGKLVSVSVKDSLSVVSDWVPVSEVSLLVDVGFDEGLADVVAEDVTGGFAVAVVVEVDVLPVDAGVSVVVETVGVSVEEDTGGGAGSEEAPGRGTVRAVGRVYSNWLGPAAKSETEREIDTDFAVLLATVKGMVNTTSAAAGIIDIPETLYVPVVFPNCALGTTIIPPVAVASPACTTVWS